MDDVVVLLFVDSLNFGTGARYGERGGKPLVVVVVVVVVLVVVFDSPFIEVLEVVACKGIVDDLVFLPVFPNADKKPRCAELKRPPRFLDELASAFGPMREEDAAPRILKCVSMGQLNLLCRDAGLSLVSSRFKGAMLGLIPAR